MDAHNIALLLYLSSLIIVAQCNHDSSDFIPLNYVSEFPPVPTREDGRHHIQISIRFINLLDINEMQGSIQVSCFFRVYWVDSRLHPQKTSKRAPVTVPQSAAERLWKPDVIIENALIAVKNGIIKPTVYNGRFWGQTLLESNYLSVRVGCSFHYHGYPFDIQMCPLHFTNMGVTTSDISLEWGQPPYSMDRNTFLTFQDRFRIRLCEEKTNPVRRTKLGEHPQKTLFFIMERNYMTYVVQLFVPSVLFMLVAWLSILVPPTMLRTRLLLNSTNLLTLFSMFVAISHAEATYIPKISYLTGLSLWMYVCVAFVFSSMLVVIFDIRLLAMLTQPRQTQRVRKLVLGFYHRRRSTRQGLEPAGSADGADEVGSSAGPGQQQQLEPPEDEDADGDLFADASSRSVAAPTAATRAEEIEYRMHQRRRTWLELTAFYEQLYLIAFPILFCAFLAAYFWFFARRRRLHLERLLSIVRASNVTTGCWCTEQDDWPGCMTEDQYPS